MIPLWSVVTQSGTQREYEENRAELRKQREKEDKLREREQKKATLQAQREAEKKAQEPTIVAVQRIIDRDKKLVGLVSSEGKNRKNATVDECITLAKWDGLKNVKVVSPKDKKPFLQGNGISLESLPTVMVQ